MLKTSIAYPSKGFSKLQMQRLLLPSEIIFYSYAKFYLNRDIQEDENTDLLSSLFYKNINEHIIYLSSYIVIYTHGVRFFTFLIRKIHEFVCVKINCVSRYPQRNHNYNGKQI